MLQLLTLLVHQVSTILTPHRLITLSQLTIYLQDNHTRTKPLQPTTFHPTMIPQLTTHPQGYHTRTQPLQPTTHHHFIITKPTTHLHNPPTQPHPSQPIPPHASPLLPPLTTHPHQTPTPQQPRDSKGRISTGIRCLEQKVTRRKQGKPFSSLWK